MLAALLGGVFVAAVTGYLIVRFGRMHANLSADLPDSGPQKFHTRPTPRVGGITVFAGAIAATIVMRQAGESSFHFTVLAFLCAALAFAGGLAEDVTQRVGVRLRLLLTFISAALAFFLLDARISQLDVPGLDWALQFTLVSFAFTLFAVGGFAQAMNIVDGFNGLAGVIALIFLGAIAYVASAVGDTTIFLSCSFVGAAIFGFLLLNYPKGLIFLGDGGAYLIGFLVAEFAVMLVHRNTEVSPWFALTLLSYPIFETLFSIYRKRVLRNQSPGKPDGLHLHMLIHKRLIRRYAFSGARSDAFWANALTSPYLWLLALLGAAPAVLFYRQTPMLQACAVGFAVFYVWLYWRIVHFKVPRLLALRWAIQHHASDDQGLEEQAKTARGPSH